MQTDPQISQLIPQVTGVAGQSGDVMINTALEFVRTHLNMEVAYLSEFIGDDLVFRAVSAPGFEDMCHVGGSIPLDQVYCRHILAGRLPELIPDTGAEDICQSLALTHAIPIKSHVSVPIRRRDGSPCGMFCCLSRSTRSDLTEIMTGAKFEMVYQPIMDANDRRPKGFEALCRFRSDPYRPPNLWFDDAERVGMQADLEIAMIEVALKALKVLPSDIYLSVNASPATVASGRLPAVFAPYPCERILLEVTEHSKIDNYDALLSELAYLRFSGVRLAIDDAGAGYSGLQHIIQLHPDVIKLDMSLTRDIDKDLVRRSLAAALMRFSSEIDAQIVAEGIETEEELAVLTDLGVPLAQGYLLARPGDLAAAMKWFDGETARSIA
ncbi:Putative cyclic-di-GMP phosphodiesterase AdrB [Roseovarius gaetbuli]|uniref:Putative cyclic-di-GMP phosphodiesterase AdrB n=1 Tax=Roseovarius gaetbuli TaxID=1356575 RepID=A0A1X6ZCG5_9RHOB|nr:EAL domain-containing protein [Roseovarius gaetbuli]SLN45700.1 Putative cyclic-di-GMP phosphodiesterase AdrB [Roseovarius gaetbuli]